MLMSVDAALPAACNTSVISQLAVRSGGVPYSQYLIEPRTEFNQEFHNLCFLGLSRVVQGAPVVMIASESIRTRLDEYLQHRETSKLGRGD